MKSPPQRGPRGRREHAVGGEFLRFGPSSVSLPKCDAATSRLRLIGCSRASLSLTAKKMGKTASTSSRFAINKNLVSGDTRISSAKNSPSSPFAPFTKTQSWQTPLANTRSASS